MSYNENLKLRKTRKKLLMFLNLFSFKLHLLSSPKKIAFIGIIITTISLLLPWVSIEINDKIISSNIFGSVFGISGIILILINILIAFFLLSNTKKENIKNLLSIFFADKILLLLLSIFNFIIIINNFFIVKGFAMFISEYKYLVGTNIALIGSILLIFGVFMDLIKHKENIGLCINEIEEEQKEFMGPKNMKLPF